jgi:hypothetical protein
MTKSLRILLVVSLGLFLSLGLAACGDDELGHNTSADGSDYTGTWTGTLNFAVGAETGTMDMVMTLTGSGSTVTGSIYEVGSPNDTNAVSGTVTAGVLSYTLQVSTGDASDPDCQGSAWSVGGTATLDAALTTMAISGSGTFCGDAGSYTGILTQ